MSTATPRLRMFAGPNGSGKSTIKAAIVDVIGPDLLGVYINPDEIENDIRASNVLDLSAYGVETTAEKVLGFFMQSSFLAKVGLTDEAAALRFDGGRLDFADVAVNSYFASVAADFIEPHKTPSCGRGQRPLALPVNCPSATPRLELSPQFKLKGAADEQVS
ncbi:MAG: hypothetical protein HYV06_03040, partial [Deltaproteobacteria bacterium]|nr:hypothetical protein [Deltaproteobacteria bacterium]